MTFKEITKWVLDKTLECVEVKYVISDASYESRIYKDKEGKLYRLSFVNDIPERDWFSASSRTKDNYHEPVEVIKKTKIVEYFELK